MAKNIVPSKNSKPRTRKDIINTLKQLFEMANQAFLDSELMDGSTLRVEGDSIAEGVKVSLIDSTGAVSNIADGEYTLKSGAKVVVKDEVIDSVTSAPAPATEDTQDTAAPADNMDAEPVSQVNPSADAVPAPAADGKTTDIEMIAKTLQEISDRLTALEAKVGADSEDMTAMAEVVDLIAKQPAVGSIEGKFKGTPAKTKTIGEYFYEVANRINSREKLNLKSVSEASVKEADEKRKFQKAAFAEAKANIGAKKELKKEQEFDFSAYKGLFRAAQR